MTQPLKNLYDGPKTQRKGTMTITLSLPKEWKHFFDKLAEDGYNRSQLFLKMARIIQHLEKYEHPGGLPRLIEALTHLVASGDFEDYLNQIKQGKHDDL